MIHSQGKASGKLILLGEHFVVYGAPAIVASVDLETVVSLEQASDQPLQVTNPDLSSEQLREAGKAAEAVFTHLSVDIANHQISSRSTIPIGSNMGSSAAFCVALARAIDDLYQLRLTDDQINQAAFSGENILHGRSSGTDTTICTYGGVLRFQKLADKLIHQPIVLASDIHLVIASAGSGPNTNQMVSQVKNWRDQNQLEFDQLCTRVSGIIDQAEDALIQDDLKMLGRLMNQSHNLLQQIDVSTPRLNELCEAALRAGALGSKLTGAGGGGIMLALCEQNKVEPVMQTLELFNSQPQTINIGTTK